MAHSVGVSMTDDGRFVVLLSVASTLVPGDTNGMHRTSSCGIDRPARRSGSACATGGGQANGDSYAGPA